MRATPHLARRGAGGLSELGYAPDEIRGALDGLRDDVGVEEMLRLALRELASTVSPTGPPGGPGRRRRRRTADRRGRWRRRPGRWTLAARPDEELEEVGLRPRTLDEFVGQAQLVEHLGIVLQAARQRRQPVDHLLFAGPPGLGKTSLAGIVATEMGAGLRITAGPVLTRAGDLAALLTDLQDGDVLFIDEIHRLHRSVEEMLYSAMEDGRLDILIGKGPTARSIRLDLPQLHAGRRDDPHRPRLGSAAGPLRVRRPARPLRPGGPARHRGAVGPDPEGRDRRRGGDPDLGALPGHAAGGQPPVAPGARLRRGPRRGLHRRGDGQRGARALRRRRAWASTRSTAPSSTRCAPASAASRSA